MPSHEMKPAARYETLAGELARLRALNAELLGTLRAISSLGGTAAMWASDAIRKAEQS